MNEDDQNPQKRRKLNDGDEDNDEEDKKEADVDCFTNVDEIGKLCYQAYCKLGKSGKPNEGEHTVLACILEAETSKARVVALATGTKCFPGNVAHRREEIVDCHAESLLKRSFKCYLLQLVEDNLGSSQNYQITDLYERILSKRQYCLFVSQTPCGCLSRWKGDGKDQPKEESLKDFKLVGVNRKPGRGELCPKAACIHKLAKWNILGLQGRQLLPLVGYPITMDKIIIGNCELEEGTFAHEQILARLTLNQDELPSSLQYPELFNFTKTPKLAFASHFRYEPFLREATGNNKTKRPCGSSITAWQMKTLHSDVSNKGEQLASQVLAGGRKLGASRQQKRDQRPRRDLSPPNEKPRPFGGGVDSEVMDGNKKAQINAHHRPADLAASDSGLYQRMAGLLLLRATRNGGDMTEGDDSEGRHSKEGAKCRLDDAQSVHSRGANDDEQLMAAYEHNWRLLQQNISIFRGWPSSDDNL